MPGNIPPRCENFCLAAQTALKGDFPVSFTRNCTGVVPAKDTPPTERIVIYEDGNLRVEDASEAPFADTACTNRGLVESIRALQAKQADEIEQ